LPTAENTHQIARRIDPATRVVYAENDPAVDFARPMALLHVGTLHHYTGDDGADLLDQYAQALPSGSSVVVAHFSDPQTDELSPLARRREQVFLRSPMLHRCSDRP
jgi:hypothetical protein